MKHLVLKAILKLCSLPAKNFLSALVFKYQWQQPSFNVFGVFLFATFLLIISKFLLQSIRVLLNIACALQFSSYLFKYIVRIEMNVISDH